jgi:hypothetical protein
MVRSALLRASRTMSVHAAILRDAAKRPLLRMRVVMDTRAFASPKGLRPRRRVKPAYGAVLGWLTMQSSGVAFLQMRAE